MKNSDSRLLLVSTKSIARLQSFWSTVKVPMNGMRRTCCLPLLIALEVMVIFMCLVWFGLCCGCLRRPMPSLGREGNGRGNQAENSKPARKARILPSASLFGMCPCQMGVVMPPASFAMRWTQTPPYAPDKWKLPMLAVILPSSLRLYGVAGEFVAVLICSIKKSSVALFVLILCLVVVVLRLMGRSFH